ncbi:quinone oxidoreductase family protein [Chitinophaga caseinilytica]|uniref:quinone oxidoreductase family protein n=1 Tax=Chitinophaga caseinilytica TaxID=2267521 RepID=UPI003C2B73D5
MKAIVQTGTGGPEVLTLRDMPLPQPKSGELLVKVSAIAVNHANKLLRNGVFPAPSPFPHVMLGEVEGYIVAVGPDVETFRPGQRVTGVSMEGFAEYAAVHASQAYLLPEGLAVAEGLLSGGFTAHHLLDQAPENIDSVLITGAAGVIGSFAVQLAQLRGVPVIGAVAGGAEKLDYLRDMGATVAVSHQTENWLQTLQSAAPEGYSLLLDAGGGPIATQLLPLLAPGGTAVLYGNMSAQPVETDGNLLAFRSLKIFGASVFAAAAADKQRWHEEMVEAVINGKLCIPSTGYEFEDYAAAFAALESRQVPGRIVLRME